MSLKQYLALLKSEFNGRVFLTEKRTGIYQIHGPFYYEDGDMVDMYVSIIDGEPCISDYGMTLMRLSYNYEIDTPNKERILKKILAENQLYENNGNIYTPIIAESMLKTVIHFVMVISKVMSMQYWSRNVVESLFFENIEEFIDEHLVKFNPSKNIIPLPERDDLVVDFAFSVGKRPIYLFPVRTHDKALLAALTMLEFQKNDLPFFGFVVTENYSALAAKDQKKLMSASDSIFFDFDQFKQDATQRIQRYTSTN